MTNHEIIEIYIKNGLLKRCIDYQFARVPNKDFKEDLFHDLILELYAYDQERLNKIHEENHMNAFFTRLILNNINSSTSWYYRRYMRYLKSADEITEKENNIPDEE